MLLSHVAFWTGKSSEGVIGGLSARGELGVAIFFALSAFLLSAPFVRQALGQSARWSLGTYLLRRAARIMPAYLLALAGVVVAAASLGGAAADALDLPTVLVHLVIGQGWTDRTFQSFTQTWSLTTEVTFYLLLPLAALLLARPTRGATPTATAHRMLIVCAVVAVAGLLGQVATGLLDPTAAGILGTSAAGHAAWFALGAAVTVVIEAEHAGHPVARHPVLEFLRTSPGTLIVLAGVLWLIASTDLAGPRGLEPSSGLESVAAEVLYGLVAVCLLLAATTRGLTEHLTDSPLAGPARWLGDISYAVFLWHVVVLQVTFAVLGLRLFAAPFVSTLVLTTVLSVGLAHLSWSLLERPLLARAHRRRHAPAPQPAPRA